MRRYIDADKLRKDVLDLPNCYNGFSDTFDKACIIGVIDEQPTVEPERKKGRWINHVDRGMCECDICGEMIETERAHRAHYCPNCGADMRGTE